MIERARTVFRVDRAGDAGSSHGKGCSDDSALADRVCDRVRRGNSVDPQGVSYTGRVATRLD